MKQERFSKAEMLHHFELIMPRKKNGKAMHVGNSSFLTVCGKQGLVKYDFDTNTYVYCKDRITKEDIDSLCKAMYQYNKAFVKKYEKKPKQQSDNLDVLAKQIAASGLYRIDEDGKLYKKTVVWKEM